MRVWKVRKVNIELVQDSYVYSFERIKAVCELLSCWQNIRMDEQMDRVRINVPRRSLDREQFLGWVSMISDVYLYLYLVFLNIVKIKKINIRRLLWHIQGWLLQDQDIIITTNFRLQTSYHFIHIKFLTISHPKMKFSYNIFIITIISSLNYKKQNYVTTAKHRLTYCWFFKTAIWKSMPKMS